MEWWAGQDSNLQPDRYERPALTIELPALSALAEHEVGLYEVQVALVQLGEPPSVVQIDDRGHL